MLYEFDQHHVSNFRQARAAVSAAEGEVSDEQLMEKIRDRDEAALATLFKRYEMMLRSIVGRVLANDQDVSDVIEEVFIGVWNQAANFDTEKGKAIGWIITMARRRAIDRVRRCQAYDRAEMRFRLETQTESSDFAAEDVNEQAANSDYAEIFKGLLDELPEAQREVVRLTFYSGLSQREIARETGIPLGTIKTRLELGVRKLRAAICKMGSKEDWLQAVV